ncbi:MAG: AAA family ATPase [Desulfomonilaceae bacterium]
MECHCHDHLPGEWHKNQKECDCAASEYPTYTFVITKVTEDDPGCGTAYISDIFMQKLQVQDGDAIEIVGSGGCAVQARQHPNLWIDSRMIALDKRTADKIGVPLYGQIKLRKTSCVDSETVTLEVPRGLQMNPSQIQEMVHRADGAIVSDRDEIVLITNRGEKIPFRIIKCEPEHVARLSPATHIHLVDAEGEDYVFSKQTTFADVGGLADAVRKVREVVQLPLRHPDIFHKLGIDPPRGVLLHGPSGTGKTLIARAVAGETGCYFKAISGTEIMDKYYGESEAKLRAAFEEASKNAPAIIFIDEIDALAPRRDKAEGEVEHRITAQLLALMDGMDDRGNVIVLAATNLPHVLDSALRRAGRFDREILIGVPDKAGRKEILRIHTRDMPVQDVDLTELSDKTHGFVGADIKALCQEAGYRALQRILPGLEDTEERLTEDFLNEILVETQDFDLALKDMRPSSARIFDVDLSRAGWDRIAGYSTEKEFLRTVVLWPLRNVEFLSGIGVNHLTGLLLTGPSGVGKTLMARSLAKESGFNVIEIRGPELISKYVGESERNVRELFRHAREMSPTVVILDGIDAMASPAFSDYGVIDRVVNQLVLEMNALTGVKPVLVVAVCNRGDDLHPVLRATGRFSTESHLKKPNQADRSLLFRMYLSNERICFNGDLVKAGIDADGLTGGDIEEVCRRVILQAARLALEEGPGEACQVTVSEDSLLKMLDRWKLIANVR